MSVTLPWRLQYNLPDGRVCYVPVDLDFREPFASVVGFDRLVKERLFDAFVVLRDELEQKEILPRVQLPADLLGKVI